MIVGNYISEEANTVEESKYPVYGFIRKVDYRRETVRYAVHNIRWFTSLVKHTVVSVGRGLFGASDQACGRILNNYDKDIIMEALHNVAEQPDFEQGLNYFSSPEDRNKAIESYIGKMIAYTATEWVRTKLKEFEQNISFESVLEERGDSVFAEIIKELGLEDADVRRLVEEFQEAMTEEGDDDYAKSASVIIDEDEEMIAHPEDALKACIFVDEKGVYRDCRLAVMIMITVFGISQNLVTVGKDSVCASLMDMYKQNPLYALASEKQEDNKSSFSSALRFGIAFAAVCGYGDVGESVLMDKLYDIFKICPMSILAKYSISYLESGKEFSLEVAE